MNPRFTRKQASSSRTESPKSRLPVTAYMASRMAASIQSAAAPRPTLRCRRTVPPRRTAQWSTTTRASCGRKMRASEMIQLRLPIEEATFAVTGHRPQYLQRWDHTSRYFSNSPYFSTKQIFERDLLSLAMWFFQEYRPARVRTGMALGWDLAVAEACLELGIPYISNLAFWGQQERWSNKDKDRFEKLLNNSMHYQIFSNHGFEPDSYQGRNEYMVDNGDLLVALCGANSGGTANTVRYAQRKNIPYVNLWENWLHGRSQGN